MNNDINQRVLTDALVVCRDCKRYLIVSHGDIKITIEDTDAKLERSAFELLEVYCAEYQAELLPHLNKLTKLKRLALTLRRLLIRPRLP